jgi:hypothetical protein
VDGAAPRDDEREQRHLEQQRLELTGPLGRHGRDDHREREREQWHAGAVGPHHERRRRERAEHEIGRGRHVRDGGDDRDHNRERGNQRPHLLGL